MKPLRLRPLHQARAEALSAACERNDHEPELRGLRQELEGLLAKARRHAPARAPKLPPAPTLKTASGAWGTKALRAALWVRSEGRCECGCRRRIALYAGARGGGDRAAHMDHYLGRARAPQTPETCWLIHPDCHGDKHAANPSRRYWHQRFLLHLEAHGFGASETAKGIRDELAAEEQLQEAQRHAARAGTSAFTSGALAGERHG